MKKGHKKNPALKTGLINLNYFLLTYTQQAAHLAVRHIL